MYLHVNLLGLLQPQGNHGHEHLLLGLHLVELHAAVELCQLLLQQLQVGVEVAQLYRHRLFHLLVGGGPVIMEVALKSLSTNFDNIRKQNYISFHVLF